MMLHLVRMDYGARVANRAALPMLLRQAQPAS